MRTLNIFIYLWLSWASLVHGQTASYGQGGYTSLANAGYTDRDASFNITFEVPPFITTRSYMILEIGGTVHGSSITLQNDKIIFYSQSPNTSSANRGAVEITLPTSSVGQTIQLVASIDRDEAGGNTSQTLALSALLSTGESFEGMPADLGIGQGTESAAHNSEFWAGGNAMSVGRAGSFAGENLFQTAYRRDIGLPTTTIIMEFYADTILDSVFVNDVNLSNVNTAPDVQFNDFSIIDPTMEGYSLLSESLADYSNVVVTLARTSGDASANEYTIESDDGVVTSDGISNEVKYGGQSVGSYTVVDGTLTLMVDASLGLAIDTAEFTKMLQSIRIKTGFIQRDDYRWTIAQGGESSTYGVTISSVALTVIDKIVDAANRDDASDVTVTDLFQASAYPNIPHEYLPIYRERIEALDGEDLDTSQEVYDFLDSIIPVQIAIDKINSAHLAGDASNITVDDLVLAGGLVASEVDPTMLSLYQDEIVSLNLGPGLYDYLLDQTEIAILVGEVNRVNINPGFVTLAKGIVADLGRITTGAQFTGFASNSATIDLNFKMLDTFDYANEYTLLEFGGTTRGVEIGLKGDQLIALNLDNADKYALHEITLNNDDLGKQLSVRLVMQQLTSTLTTTVYVIRGDGAVTTSGPVSIAAAAWVGTDIGSLGHESNLNGANPGDREVNGVAPLGNVGSNIYPIPDGRDRNLIYAFTPSVLLPAFTSQPAINNFTSDYSQVQSAWEYFDEGWTLSDYAYERAGDFDGAVLRIQQAGGVSPDDHFQLVFTDTAYSVSGDNIYYGTDIIATKSHQSGDAGFIEITFDSSAITPDPSSLVLVGGNQIVETHLNTIAQSIQYLSDVANENFLEATFSVNNVRSATVTKRIFTTPYTYGVDIKHHTDGPAGDGVETAQNFTSEGGASFSVPIRIENTARQIDANDSFLFSIPDLPAEWEAHFVFDYNQDGILQATESDLAAGEFSMEGYEVNYVLARIFIPADAIADFNADGVNDFNDYPLTITATSVNDPAQSDSISVNLMLELFASARLFPDLELSGTSGGVVEYNHTLDNNSEVDLTFDLHVAHQVTDWKFVLLDDAGSRLTVNTDGSSTITVPAFSETDFKLRLIVPSQAPHGFTQVTTLTAIPTTVLSDTNALAVINITQVVNGPVSLFKSVSSNTGKPGDTLTITTEWKNKGAKAITDFTIYDPISSHTSMVQDSVTINSALFFSGTTDQEQSTNGGVNWSTLIGSGVNANITNIRVRYNGEIVSGDTGSFSYQVLIK